jgi:hypothetical protein
VISMNRSRMITSMNAVTAGLVLAGCVQPKSVSGAISTGSPAGVYKFSRTDSVGSSSIEDGSKLELDPDGTMREGPLRGRWTAYDDYIVVRDIVDSANGQRFSDSTNYGFRGHYGHSIYLRLHSGSLLRLLRESSPVQSSLVFKKVSL